MKIIVTTILIAMAITGAFGWFLFTSEDPELGVAPRVQRITQGGTQTATAPANGQLLMGKTDGSYAVNTLTAGTNVTITEGDGTISIASTGGGGGGAGNVATSTNETSTEVAYWTSTGATPATLGSDAGLTYNDGTNALTATTFIGALNGNAGTATALAANPVTCTNQFVRDFDADGTLVCATVDDASVANNITIDLATLATTLTVTDNEDTAETNAVLFTAGGALGGGSLGIESDGTFNYNPSTGAVSATLFIGSLTGTAFLATASVDNPDNCSAGSYPLGVDANWDVESCTDASTEIDSIVATHAGVTEAHQPLITLAGVPNYLTLVGSTQVLTLTVLDINDDTNATGGVGIDITTNDFTFDATELDALTWDAGSLTDFTWTWNLSGTDPTLLFKSAGFLFGGSLEVEGNASTTGSFSIGTGNDGNTFASGDLFISGAATTSGQFNVGDDANTATSTLIIGNSNVLNGGCVVIEDYDGAGLTFLVTLDGTGTFSQTDCRINI